MNYLVLSYLLFFLICNVWSQDSGTCDLRITDLKHNEIDMSSHCNSQKPCVVKCCPENEVFHAHGRVTECKNIEVLRKTLNHNMSFINFDYHALKLYKDDDYDVISSKKYKDFTILHSDLYMSKPNTHCSYLKKKPKELRLLERGTLMVFMPNHYEYWTPTETPDFCVDMVVGINKTDGKPMYMFYYKIKNNNEKDLIAKLIFTATGMLTSTFFLFLVLVVYSILHQLRNIQGMLLYAYVATLMGVYLLKASSTLNSLVVHYSGKKQSTDCTVITQITYFLILASFFWLKLMCFNIWWTFRGSRKLKEIHRRGINVKMMIYASYAFGVPAAMTIFAVVMDNQDLPPHVAKPMFNQCFVTDTTIVYLYVPLMILTGCNCLLFLMTMYNIWLIKRNLAAFDKATAKKTDNNQNTLKVYIKLSSLMGVSWILELLQIRLPDEAVPLWLFILLNTYNVFIGVIIFFLFVFKTNIFLMLCQRFKMERWAHRHYKVNSSTGIELSKGSKTYSRTYSRTRSTSDAEEGIPINRLEPKDREAHLTTTDV